MHLCRLGGPAEIIEITGLQIATEDQRVQVSGITGSTADFETGLCETKLAGLRICSGYYSLCEPDTIFCLSSPSGS